MEEAFNWYKAKLESIEQDRENIKTELYLHAKIEAHLEMICLIGLEMLGRAKAKNGRKKV
jgi:hypothetical protein